MEISQTEIIQRKREIDELAGLHRLEEWQKDRLFQEYVRRKSMGYEVSLLNIAKEWGWIDSETLPEEAPVKTETLTPVVPEVEIVESKDSAMPTEQSTPSVEVAKPVEISPIQEQLPTQEISSQETAEQPTPSEAPKPEEAQPQLEQLPPVQQVQTSQPLEQLSDYADNYNKEIVVGYKLPSGIYNDPDRIAQQAKGGALEEASTWISTKLSQLFGISQVA